MKRALLLLLLPLLACGGDEPTEPTPIISPSPSPLPSPSPSPSPSPAPITVVRTLITAHNGGSEIFAWPTGVVPTLEARQICLQSTHAASFAHLSNEQFLRKFHDEIVPCPARVIFGNYGWSPVGPAFCQIQGDRNGPTIRLQCFRPVT